MNTDLLQLEIANESSLPPALSALAARVAKATATAVHMHGTVSLRVCSDQDMHNLNHQFRNVDRPTDVLAFPSGEVGTDNHILGDIALSHERTLSQGLDFGHGSEREFAYLLTHALLHLAGHSHEKAEDYANMRELEERILACVGLSRETATAR